MFIIPFPNFQIEMIIFARTGLRFGRYLRFSLVEYRAPQWGNGGIFKGSFGVLPFCPLSGLKILSAALTHFVQSKGFSPNSSPHMLQLHEAWN
jgi:hypothetical protein